MKLKSEFSLESTVSGKALLEAVKKIKSFTDASDAMDTEKKHVLMSGKEGLLVIGCTPESFSCILVEANTDKSGALIFEVDKVIGLLKGRSEVNISIASSKLQIKETKGRYKATTDIEKVEDADMLLIRNYYESEPKKKLSNEVVKSLREGVRAARLEDHYTQSDILAYVIVDKAFVRVSCFDNYHVARYQAEVESKTKLKMVFSTHMFNIADKFIGDDKINVDVSDSGNIRMRSDSFVLCLPEVQYEDAYFGMAEDYIGALKKPLCTATFDRKDAGVVDNMTAVSDNDTKMVLKTGKKGIQLKLTTKGGSVEDVFSAKPKGDSVEAHIEYRIFKELFGKVSDDDVNIAFYKGLTGATASFMLHSNKNGADLKLIGTYYTS